MLSRAKTKQPQGVQDANCNIFDVYDGAEQTEQTEQTVKEGGARWTATEVRGRSMEKNWVWWLMGDGPFLKRAFPLGVKVRETR